MDGRSPGSQQPGESSFSSSDPIGQDASYRGDEVNDPSSVSGLPAEDRINDSLLAG